MQRRVEQSRAELSRQRRVDRAQYTVHKATNHSEQCNQNIITHIIAPVLSPNHRDANVSSL